MIEGKIEHENDRWIGAAAAVIWKLYQTVVVKTEQSLKVKLLINQSILVPMFNVL